MAAVDRTLIPYRLRTVRVGIQTTALALLVVAAFWLLSGRTVLSSTEFVGFSALLIVGTLIAAVLPWRRMFESRVGIRTLYAWSIADILLITAVIGFSDGNNPNLFFLYAFTTLFFATSYPVRSQIALFAFTVVAYGSLWYLTGPVDPLADVVFRFGVLLVIAFMASFLSRELMQQMRHVTRSRIELEHEKSLYESLVQAQSDLGEGIAIADLNTRRFQYVNDALCRLYGYSRAELLGMSYMDLVDSSEERAVEELRRRREAGLHTSEYHQDFTVRRKDGTRMVVEIVTKPLSEDRVMSLVRDVTEQRAAETALIRREELFRAVSELASDFVFSIQVGADGSQRWEWVTDSFTRLTGYSVDDPRIKGGWVALIHPDDLSATEEIYKRLLRGGTSFNAEVRIVTKSGEIRMMQAFARAVRDGRGRVVRLYGGAEDITETKQGADALRQRAEILEAISEFTTDYVYSLELAADGTASWEWVTDGFEHITGFTPEEGMERGGWTTLLHPDDVPYAMKIYEELLAEPDRSAVSELRIITKSGAVKHIRTHARTVWDRAAGRAVRIFGAVQDITEAKAAADALRESEVKYRNLFERVPIGLFMRTPSGEGLDANPVCVAMYGYPDKKTFLEIPASELYVNPKDRERWLKQMAEGESRGFEAQFRRYDGSRFWARLSGRAVTDEEGKVIFYEGTVEDVSEQHAAEEGVRSSLSLLRTTLESTADGLLVVDPDGHIVTYNQKFAEMWRIPESVLATGDDDRALAVVTDQLVDPDGFLHRVRELYSSPSAASFDILEFKDGRTFERYSQPQRLGDKIVGRVWSFRDVTDRRHLEDQLRQAQKMEAVGRLAGGVAHDFNNLLTAMLGYCELILGRNDLDAELMEEISEIEQAAQTGADIAAQLLDLSRRRVLRPEVLDVNEIVRSTEPMLRRLIGDDVVLEAELLGEAAKVEADRSQVEQIILNLVVNARDAMPEGGEIGITVERVDVSRQMAARRLRLSPGRHVLLTVSDDGEGIDPSIRDRIFEPFFTTRPGSRGTGLGLSTVYGIVSHYGGHIEVESDPGEGAAFRIYLPEATAEPVPMARKRAMGRWLAGTERVLLVEDDDALRRLARRALERYGYRIVEASSGSEALKAFRDAPETFDALVTDVVMAGMNGRELGAELVSASPNLRILYMSGYTGDALERVGVLGDNEDFLAKPFRPDDLALKLRELLNRGSDSSATI